MNKEKQQVFERVRVENDELREKIGKLRDFLKSEKIKQIDKTQAYLLRLISKMLSVVWIQVLLDIL